VGGAHRRPAAGPIAARRGRQWLVALLLLAMATTAGAAQLGVLGGESAAAPAGRAPVPGHPARHPGAVDPDPGDLSAGGASLLPLAGIAGPDGELSALAGWPVRGRAVVVESVPADEGFWVGTGGADRVWVQLAGAGESPYRVRPGERVDLSGQVVAHGPGYSAAVGVAGDEGADQLTRQAAHLEVAQRDLRLTRPS
jgi:hypothetical protein